MSSSSMRIITSSSTTRIRLACVAGCASVAILHPSWNRHASRSDRSNDTLRLPWGAKAAAARTTVGLLRCQRPSQLDLFARDGRIIRLDPMLLNPLITNRTRRALGAVRSAAPHKNQTPKMALGDTGPELRFCRQIPHAETKPYPRNAALPRRFE